MVFFTSDWHMWHINILKMCNRPFETIEQMNETIISNHNSVVTDNDTTYNLGDLFYKANPVNVAKVFEKLNGKHLILPGNHEKVFQQALKRGYLNDLISSGKVEIIGDFYPSQTMKIVEIEKKTLVLFHYSSRSWPHSRRDSIHLHAHSHGKLPPLYKSFDVGVDAWNFFPVSFTQVLEKVENIQEFKEI